MLGYLGTRYKISNKMYYCTKFMLFTVLSCKLAKYTVVQYNYAARVTKAIYIFNPIMLMTSYLEAVGGSLTPSVDIGISSVNHVILLSLSYKTDYELMETDGRSILSHPECVLETE